MSATFSGTRVSSDRSVRSRRSFVRRVAALSRGERRLIVAAFPLVVAVRVALWILPSRVIVRLVRLLASGDVVGPSAAIPRIEDITWAIGASSSRVPGASCLTQAVAAQLLLRHYHYQSYIVLGAGRSASGNGFFAHAWLEHDGRVLIGGSQSAHLSRLPPLRGTIVRNRDDASR